MSDPKAVLLRLNQNLNILQERAAKYAGNAPLELLNQIDDHKTAIRLTEQYLIGRLNQANWQAQLKPLLLAVREGQVVNVEVETYVAGDLVQGDQITLGPVNESTVAAGERSAAAAPGGIAISGNVGRDLTISIGSTSLSIPRRLQLVLGLVLGLVMVGVLFLVGVQLYSSYANAQPIEMPAGTFNIAVARFQVEGKTEPGYDAAQEIAAEFAENVDRRKKELEDQLDWPITIRLPDETGPIYYDNETSQTAKARSLAQTIKADIVIYGTIEVAGRQAVIKPNFYVNEEKFDLTLAAELKPVQTEVDNSALIVGGEYRLGAEIVARPVNDIVEKQRVRTILEGRFQALTFMAYGLSFFSRANYDQAETYFNSALEESLRPNDVTGEPAWDKPDVIYLMLGNVALMRQEAETAADYYRQALAANENYPRAQAGLGGAYYLQAVAARQMQRDQHQAILDLIERSVTAYQQALELGPVEPGQAKTSAAYGLGRAYLLKALTEFAANQDYEQALTLAIEKFEAVIQDYEAKPTWRLKELAAYAYGSIAFIYQITGWSEDAVTNYDRALQFLISDDLNFERTRDEQELYREGLVESCRQLAGGQSPLPESCP